MVGCFEGWMVAKVLVHVMFKMISMRGFWLSVMDIIDNDINENKMQELHFNGNSCFNN